MEKDLKVKIEKISALFRAGFSKLRIVQLTSKSSGARGERIQSKGYNFGAPLHCTGFHPSWRTEIVGMCGWD